MAEKEEADKKMVEMVKAVNENPAYKILTREEYDLLIAAKDEKGPGKPKLADLVNKISTPAPRPGTPDVKPKAPKFQTPGFSPVPRLNLDTSHNITNIVSGPYIPKLPVFSGSEEPQKGETSYEVWNFEVKCLQKSSTLSEPLLLQSIRNSLRGTPRSILVSLGENASVSDVLDKLNGFYGTVSSSETLLQSFFSDSRKDNESIVAYGSRLEQTITKAIASGHIDEVAKDAMLRSKFWSGLKTQSLKNSTRHLYDTIKDFHTLLREIRKVDQEDSSSKSSKKQAAQQQHTSQVTGASASEGSPSDALLKKMSEMMGQMQKLLDQQSSQNSDSNQSFSGYGHNQQYFRSGGRSYRNRGHRGGYGRGYNNYQNQSGNQNQQNSQSDNSQGGFRGGGSRRGYRGGTNGRGAHRGGNAGNSKNPLNS